MIWAFITPEYGEARKPQSRAGPEPIGGPEGLGYGPQQLIQGRHMRRLISSGSEFEARIGYSRAVVDGDLIFVSGTTGFDYAAGTISPDVTVQAAQALRNIEAALAQCGAQLADIVRVNYYLLDADAFRACWPVLRGAFAAIRPAATMLVVAGLADPRMKIEIEVTARRQTGTSP